MDGCPILTAGLEGSGHLEDENEQCRCNARPSAYIGMVATSVASIPEAVRLLTLRTPVNGQDVIESDEGAASSGNWTNNLDTASSWSSYRGRKLFARVTLGPEGANFSNLPRHIVALESRSPRFVWLTTEETCQTYLSGLWQLLAAESELECHGPARNLFRWFQRGVDCFSHCNHVIFELKRRCYQLDALIEYAIKGTVCTVPIHRLLTSAGSTVDLSFESLVASAGLPKLVVCQNCHRLVWPCWAPLSSRVGGPCRLCSDEANEFDESSSLLASLVAAADISNPSPTFDSDNRLTHRIWKVESPQEALRGTSHHVDARESSFDTRVPCTIARLHPATVFPEDLSGFDYEADEDHQVIVKLANSLMNELAQEEDDFMANRLDHRMVDSAPILERRTRDFGLRPPRLVTRSLNHLTPNGREHAQWKRLQDAWRPHQIAEGPDLPNPKPYHHTSTPKTATTTASDLSPRMSKALSKFTDYPGTVASIVTPDRTIEGESSNTIDFPTNSSPVEQYAKTKMCAQFRMGQCKRGSQACKFAHSLQELRATTDVYKTKMCAFWVVGHCKAGPACRHAHGEAELRQRRSRKGANIAPTADAPTSPSPSDVAQQQAQVHPQVYPTGVLYGKGGSYSPTVAPSAFHSESMEATRRLTRPPGVDSAEVVWGVPIDWSKSQQTPVLWVTGSAVEAPIL